jgi:hypothetical protein
LLYPAGAMSSCDARWARPPRLSDGGEQANGAAAPDPSLNTEMGSPEAKILKTAGRAKTRRHCVLRAVLIEKDGVQRLSFVVETKGSLFKVLGFRAGKRTNEQLVRSLFQTSQCRVGRNDG